MKKIFILLMTIFGTVAMAQLPQSFMYQTVLHNGAGSVLGGQRISAKVSILKTSATGTAVYEETHSATTAADGVLTLEVGRGTVVSGTFASIDWLSDKHFLKTEIDPIGGSNYQLVATQQLLSVPYAFVSGKTRKLTGVDSALAVLDSRFRRADSLIAVFNVQIRQLNDSIRTLSSSPSMTPAQLQVLAQRKAALETTLSSLRTALTATKNEQPAELPRQQAVENRAIGHSCNR